MRLAREEEEIAEEKEEMENARKFDFGNYGILV